MRASSGTKHISGAEGIYDEHMIESILKDYILRALGHERGIPQKVILTVEPLYRQVLYIPTLPVYTVNTKSISEAWDFIEKTLLKTGISKNAFQVAYSIVHSDDTMRGASLVHAKSARRLEPDSKRGIRARLLGITDQAKQTLTREIYKHGLNQRVVSEALILASKVQNAPDILAELCVSDNPSYCTGYVSIRGFGYIRIPNIKVLGSQKGGRVFFLKDGSAIDKTIDFLENTPTVVNEISAFHGIINADEILSLLDNKSCLRKVL